MKRQLTAEQTAARDERRAKFKVLWKQVAAMPELERVHMAAKYGFRTVEGRELSLCNSMLIALQLPGASVLGGFRQWLKQGRCVRKGEHGAMIWVPTGCRKAGEPVESPANGSPVPDAEGQDTRFIIGTVFDISQTEETNGATAEPSAPEPAELSVPHAEKVVPLLPVNKKTIIEPDVQTILANATFTADSVQLNGQLDRAMYVKVNKVLEMAGGTWNRKRKAHVFAQNPADVLDLGSSRIVADAISADGIQNALKSGVQVVSAPNLFPTPKDVAKELVKLAEILPEHRILEPSAGTGNLLLAVHEAIPLSHWPRLDIVAVEINPQLAKRLDSHAKDVRCADFLTCNGDLGTFDRIVMNPPFEKGSDIRHIKHAMGFLNPGGRLVAICGNGPKQKDALQPFCDAWIDLPPNSFKESGTGVNAAILVFNK